MRFYYILICLTASVIVSAEEQCKVERCPPSSPVHCPGNQDLCISIHYLCDGTDDCPDGYDEDRKLCTAIQRHGVTEISKYLQTLLKNHFPNYLVMLLGPKAKDSLKLFGGAEKVAAAFAESYNLEEFGKALDLQASDLENLSQVFRDMQMKDTSELKSKYEFLDDEIPDAKSFANKLVKSGFLD